MARKIIWSQEAVTDLRDIAEFIGRDSFFYVATFVQEIIFASQTLKKFAERGRVVPEISNPKIRELLVQDYRLIYKVSRLRIEILGIIHGRRDLKKLWKREDT